MAAISSSSYTRTKLILRVNTGCAFVYLGGKRVEETNEQITYIVHNTVFFHKCFIPRDKSQRAISDLFSHNTDSVWTYYYEVLYGSALHKFLDRHISVRQFAYKWYVSFTCWTYTSQIHAKSPCSSVRIDA